MKAAPAPQPAGVRNASVRGYMLAGAVVILLLVGGVGVWAAQTEIAGAVIAPGTVVVDSNIKKVQHPTGGIVGEIRVKNGDRVSAGDLLMRLDETVTRANLQMISKQLDELQVREARLKAGDLAGAITALNDASDLDPGSPAPINLLCKVYEQKKDWEEVVRIKTRRLDVVSGDERSALLLDIGDILATNLNDRTRAAKSYVAALDERPDDRRHHRRLHGWRHGHHGNHDWWIHRRCDRDDRRLHGRRHRRLDRDDWGDDGRFNRRRHADDRRYTAIEGWRRPVTAATARHVVRRHGCGCPRDATAIRTPATSQLRRRP